MSRSPVLILLLSLLVGAASACGRKEPEAAAPPAAPPAAAKPPEAVPSPPSVPPELPKARPSVFVFVEGGPDEQTIWRGWPVIVHAEILEGEAKAELTIRGPSAPVPERRDRLWVIPPAASRQLAPGAYTFGVGAGSAESTVSDPPAVLTPEQLATHRRLSTYADLALGNHDGALKTAREWVAAEPKSIEARSVLGDALRAAGDRAGAAAAYDEALRLLPRGVHPPESLYAGASDGWRQETAGLAGKPVDPAETEFHQAIDGAHAALKSGNRAEAERGYAAAAALHRDRKLVISRRGLEKLRAALDAVPAAPRTPDVPKGAPAVAAKAPEAAKVGAPSAGVVVPASELNDEKVRAEAAGQWAATATAGSQYGSMAPYSAAKATGAPDVPVAGNSPAAWCPAGKNAGTDWLEAAFATPVHATEIRVRQNDTAGAIARIEAVEPDGSVHLWWEGVDPLAPKSREIVWFAVRVPKTPYLVAKVKVTLNLAAVTGWKEIDAVQLVGAP